jgi:hypothetical protein
MYMGFAGRLIANPAPLFFDKPILSSQDPEFGGATPSVVSPVQRQIDTLLGQNSNPEAAEKLAAMHVKYIILAKEDDYRTYAPLTRQPDIKLVMDGPSLLLYRNEAVR